MACDMAEGGGRDNPFGMSFEELIRRLVAEHHREVSELQQQLCKLGGGAISTDSDCPGGARQLASFGASARAHRPSGPWLAACAAGMRPGQELCAIADDEWDPQLISVDHYSCFEAGREVDTQSLPRRSHLDEPHLSDEVFPSSVGLSRTFRCDKAKTSERNSEKAINSMIVGEAISGSQATGSQAPRGTVRFSGSILRFSGSERNSEKAAQPEDEEKTVIFPATREKVQMVNAIRHSIHTTNNRRASAEIIDAQAYGGSEQDHGEPQRASSQQDQRSRSRITVNRITKQGSALLRTKSYRSTKAIQLDPETSEETTPAVRWSFWRRSARPRSSRAFKVRKLHSFKSTSEWLINPEQSAFLERWDFVTILALAFVAIVAPVQATMMQAKFDWLFFVNCLVDLVFIIDMVVQFFLMYPIKTDSGYTLEHRHSQIVNHYLRSWFIIDFCSIVPWDLFGILSESAGMKQMKEVKVIRLLRLLKLIRVMKVSRVFRRFEVRMSVTYSRLALVKFFVVMAVITHWMANLWAMCLVLVTEEDNVPRWIDVFDAMEKNVAVMTKDSPAKLYVACLYFTSYTITSVGYGDIGPKNITERVVCTIMIIISGISWAVVLGQVCGIIAGLDSDEQAFRKTMDELNLMMKDRRMAKPIRRRLRSFFLSNKTAQRRGRHQKILNSISPGLQGEVVMELNRQWVMKVPFLRGIISEANQSARDSQFSFIVDISKAMRGFVYAQQEIFGAPQVLYILVRGLVSRYVRLHRSGSVWGTDFVLVDSSLAEPAECFALTYVEVTTLLRAEFMSVLDTHQALCPELTSRVRRFCIWTAFQRAIVGEARRRVKESRRRLTTSPSYNGDAAQLMGFA